MDSTRWLIVALCAPVGFAIGSFAAWRRWPNWSVMLIVGTCCVLIGFSCALWYNLAE